MKHLVVVCIFLALLSVGVLAQEPANSLMIRELALEPPTDNVRMLAVATGLVGSCQCDSDGGVYARPEGSGLTHPLHVPIMRLSKDKQPIIFDIGPAPKGAENYLHAFSVDAGGEVVALVATTRESSSTMSLITFRPDGSILRRTLLDSTFIPLRMSAMPDDEVLISGFEHSKDKNKGFIRIYGKDGKLKRSLYEQEKPTGKGGKYDPTIQFGSAQAGPDGMIYVLKGTKPAILEVFTPEGTRPASHKLVPPFKDAQSVDFHLAYPRVVVMYQRSMVLEKNREPEMRMDYTVYDVTTGEPQLNLVQRAPGMMVCVVRNEMIFLTAAKDGFLSIGTRPLP
jgi:hypothetical protein